MLPKLDSPRYEIDLPIAKKKFQFRPFLIKEQKILLVANESEDPEFLVQNLKQIIKNCCLNDIDVDSLSSLDIEYIFLNLRARSVGEQIETNYRCENKVDGESCKNLMNVSIDLLDIDTDFKNYKDIIQITENIGIKMKYPDFKTIQTLTENNKDVVEKTFDAIYQCIEYIYDNDNFYYPKEVQKSDIVDFIESLTMDQFKNLEEYFYNLPKLKKELEVICSKCGYTHTIKLEGLNNFLE